MNLKRSVCLAAAVTCTFILSASAGVEAPFEIGTWGNFAKGAVSHTFDDYPQECKNLVTTGRTLFNDAKLPMTLFVIVNKCDNSAWTALKSMVAEGHEVGSHGNHDNTDRNFDTKSTIETNIPGYKCVSWAYPYCNDAQGVLNSYVAARDCDGSPNKASPTDFANIEAQLFSDAGQSGCKNSSTLNALADDAASAGGWSVYLHHGLDGSHSYTTSSNNLKNHLAYLNQKRSTIWCETFGNVALYIKERNAASLAVKSTTDNSITVSLTDNLDDATYNFPLTIRRELPSGWTTAVVTQKGKEIKDSIVTVNSKKYVMFDAVPDGGDIVISSSATAVKEQIRLDATGKMVLIDNSRLSINSHQFSGEKIAVTLLSLNGKVIANYTLSNKESSVALPKNINSSVFMVKVADGVKTYCEKFVPQM